MSIFSAIGGFFHPSQQQRQTVNSNVVKKIPGGGSFMQHYQDIQNFKKGGKVKKTGLAKVHKGERVLTKKQAEKFERVKKKVFNIKNYGKNK